MYCIVLCFILLLCFILCFILSRNNTILHYVILLLISLVKCECVCCLFELLMGRWTCNYRVCMRMCMWLGTIRIDG